MKKWIFVLVFLALAGAAWTVAVFVTGHGMEKKYYSLLNEISAQTGSVSLASKNYDRGFLKARAITEVRLEMPLAAGITGPGGLRFEIVHDLRHGPLFTGRTVDGRRHWGGLLGIVESRLANNEANRELLQQIPELARGWSSSVFYWRGGSENRFDVPAFRRELADGAVFSIGGVHGDLTAAAGVKKIQGDFRLPKIEFTHSGGGVRVEEASSEFSLEEAFGGLYLGQVNNRISHLQIQSHGNPPLAFTGLMATTDSRQTGHLIEIGEILELQNVTSKEKTLGSGRLDLQFRNISGPALAKFQADLKNIRRKGAGEETAAAMRIAAFEFLSGLSTEAPQLEVRQLQIVAPQGRFEGHALMRLSGKEKLGPAGIAAAFDRFLAESEFKVSRELAVAMLALQFGDAGKETGTIVAAQLDEEGARKKAEDRLAAWTEENLLVAEGDKLRFSAAFREGVLTVNGQPFGGEFNGSPITNR